ncbi:MAG: tetratricopeptide repeat protein [Candidatus Riflebacteria bacterium]|nr:tetratricopeptide repeat protein [Candidatus Riflebacteria bacterium]
MLRRRLRSPQLLLVGMVIVPLCVLAASPSPGPPPAPSASPAGAPSLTMTEVSAETTEFNSFLVSLARGKGQDGSPKLSVTPKVLTDKQQFTLADDDLDHVKKHQTQLVSTRFFSLLDPARQGALTDAFKQMTQPQAAPTGVSDQAVIQYEATRQLDRWVAHLSSSLDQVKEVIEARQKKVGIAVDVASLWRPPLPQATPSPGAPPSPVSTPPGAAAQDARSAEADPCAEVAAEVKSLRQETQGKLMPIRELISVGDRALAKRYFEEARDAFEKVSDVSDDLERKWHRILADTLTSVSTEERFKPECTRVISESLSWSIAMKDVLRTVYPKLGQAYYWLKKYDLAADQIRRSTEIDPSEAKTWDALGQAEYRKGQYDQAIVALTHATEIDPYAPEAWYLLAKAFAKSGQPKKALYYLRRAITKGYVKFEEADSDPDLETLQGLADFEELIHLSPGTPY